MPVGHNIRHIIILDNYVYYVKNMYFFQMNKSERKPLFVGMDNDVLFLILMLICSQQAHDVKTTSYRRRCDVTTSHRL